MNTSGKYRYFTGTQLAFIENAIAFEMARNAGPRTINELNESDAPEAIKWRLGSRLFGECVAESEFRNRMGVDTGVEVSHLCSSDGSVIETFITPTILQESL